MQTHATAMSLADFLAAVAEQEASNGKDINADIYRQRAAEAATLQRTVQHLRDEHDAMATRMAEAQRVMRGV